jgi:hypothetical protein
MPSERPDTPQSLPAFELAVPPQGVAQIYVNVATLTWTGSDLTASLYQLIQPNRDIPSQKDSPILLMHNASVTLTWSNAKIFFGHLKEAIERYEKANGPIKTEFQSI